MKESLSNILYSNGGFISSRSALFNQMRDFFFLLQETGLSDVVYSPNTFYFQVCRNKSTYTLTKRGNVNLHNTKLVLNLPDFVSVGMYAHLGYFQIFIKTG